MTRANRPSEQPVKQKEWAVRIIVDQMILNRAATTELIMDEDSILYDYVYITSSTRISGSFPTTNP
jgi:hypothetical protein